MRGIMRTKEPVNTLIQNHFSSFYSELDLPLSVKYTCNPNYSFQANFTFDYIKNISDLANDWLRISPSLYTFLESDARVETIRVSRILKNLSMHLTLYTFKIFIINNCYTSRWKRKSVIRPPSGKEC